MDSAKVSKGVVSAALSIAAGVAMDVSQSNPALAQDGSAGGGGCCGVDWNKLNLTSSQQSQIKEIDQEWYRESQELIPQIREEQGKLQRVLADRSSDGMQVMELQQHVESRKTQLRLAATRTYLAKKKVLDESQKKQLEDMMRVAVNNRKNQMFPGSQTEVMPDKIQSLMQRVRDIWPVNGDR